MFARFARSARQIVDWLQARGAQRVLEQLACEKLAHKTDRKYQVWQEGSHPEMIQGEAMMRRKVTYIHENPVKRGNVDEAIHWRYSSATRSDYAGLPGLLEVTRAW